MKRQPKKRASWKTSVARLIEPTHHSVRICTDSSICSMRLKKSSMPFLQTKQKRFGDTAQPVP